MPPGDPECGGGDQQQQQQQSRQSTVWCWQPQRGFLLRRRRLQTQRLGGKKPRRRMAALVNVFRKMKMKLKLKNACMVKKVKECYRNVMKDMAEAGGSIEQYNQMLLLETTFAVPIGLTFSGTYPCRFGPDHHRQPIKTLFM